MFIILMSTDVKEPQVSVQVTHLEVWYKEFLLWHANIGPWIYSTVYKSLILGYEWICITEP